MTKDISKPAAPENLVETSQAGAIELSEAELQKVAAARKSGGDPVEYLKIKLTDVIISG